MHERCQSTAAGIVESPPPGTSRPTWPDTFPSTRRKGCRLSRLRSNRQYQLKAHLLASTQRRSAACGHAKGPDCLLFVLVQREDAVNLGDAEHQPNIGVGTHDFELAAGFLDLLLKLDQDAQNRALIVH